VYNWARWTFLCHELRDPFTETMRERENGDADIYGFVIQTWVRRWDCVVRGRALLVPVGPFIRRRMGPNRKGSMGEGNGEERR
jgi:hypothetical protein